MFYELTITNLLYVQSQLMLESINELQRKVMMSTMLDL